MFNQIYRDSRHIAGAWNRRHTLSVVVLVITAGVGVTAAYGQQAATLAVGTGGVVVVALLGFGMYRLLRQLHSHSGQVQQSAAEAEQHYIDVLRRVIHTVEARDKYMVGHSERVGQLARSLAERMGLSQQQCRMLQVAAQLHDIGMVAIPQQMVNTKARIDVQGFRQIKKHSEIGYEVLKPLESLAEVLPAVRYHHERMNGTGYPAGRRGDEIPLAARILAVADSYDAMTHDRPYRPAMMPMAAVQELRRCTPAGYDPQCVEALGEVMRLPQLEETMQSMDAE
ncbi:MAG: HD-GYP domain-containing protein [Phycisphaerae bacterium]|nr:HD-GYP domain-containing protein [Phycisphaerae bacterium]